MKIMKCDFCGKDFEVSDRKFIRAKYEKKVGKQTNFYCGEKCRLDARGFKPKQEVECKNCGEKFMKAFKELQKTPNSFCSRSCAGTYNNKNRKHGYRRSKLEIWLEDQLKGLYPKEKILFNCKEAIGSELDIHFEDLDLAFELNGIFHYEPIFGKDKLNQIQENDKGKFQACIEKGISLCIIDTSKQKYFKESSSKEFLDIILKIVKERKQCTHLDLNQGLPDYESDVLTTEL